MNERSKENRLLDRYIQGDLSGTESLALKATLESDVSLRNRLELRRHILAGIVDASDRRLKGTIVSMTNYRKSFIPFGLKVTLTFLILVAAGSLVWNYLGTDSALSKRAVDFTRFVRKATRLVSKQPSAPPKAERKPTATKDTAIYKDDQTILDTEAVAPQVDSVSFSSDQEEIIVRKDQLLIASRIVLDDRSTGTRKSSMSAEAARQLNPAAGLPEEKEPKNSVEVEFWVNPVNYKGYRWSNDKLVLFGIEHPDQILLFRIDDLIYMKSEGEFFELSPAVELQAYRTLRDPEKMKSLK
ncbi:MAG: hypothetical protein ACKO1U_00605 [Bacteroidota bacterium]